MFLDKLGRGRLIMYIDSPVAQKVIILIDADLNGPVTMGVSTRVLVRVCGERGGGTRGMGRCVSARFMALTAETRMACPRGAAGSGDDGSLVASTPSSYEAKTGARGTGGGGGAGGRLSLSSSSHALYLSVLLLSLSFCFRLILLFSLPPLPTL